LCNLDNLTFNINIAEVSVFIKPRHIICNRLKQTNEQYYVIGNEDIYMLPEKFWELSHFELCLGHNSETTKDILFYVQNLVGEHHPVQPALVFTQENYFKRQEQKCEYQLTLKIDLYRTHSAYMNKVIDYILCCK
jgi:hypothetical protein